jgi:O-antigen/teichoic acid export membrane protein
VTVRPSKGSASSKLAFLRHVLYNLLGQGAPLLAAVFAIPRLIHGLGTDRFGVLTLAWMVIGYFSLFDFGLSRALTQVVSADLADRQSTHAPSLVWPALTAMALLGGVGSLVAGFTSPWLVHSVLRIPPELQGETLRAFVLLAIAIPIVVATSGLVGVLTAFHRFGIINAIRAPLGVLTFMLPLATLAYSRSLVAVVGALIVARTVALIAHIGVTWRLMPPLTPGLLLRVRLISPLFRFGAWMTVTNIISPILAYLDRFVVGALLSVAAVAYYATPYEMVTKLLVVPGAILGVLFPAIAATYAVDESRTVRLLERATKYVALILFPAALMVVCFASEGLTLWLGAAFAQHSTIVLQWLAIGVFVNGIAQVFATLIQGMGRPDMTAKLHLIEVPLYLTTLWWAITRYGIAGAAVAWTARVLVDGALLFWASHGLLRVDLRQLRRIGAGVLVAVGALFVAILLDGFAYRRGIAIIAITLLLPFAWFIILDLEDRAMLTARRVESR